MFAEVQYFFQTTVGDQKETLALISHYSKPDSQLLEASSGALLVCKYQGDASLEVISAKKIASCVAMIPFRNFIDNQFFVCEKMGLEVAYLAGIEEEEGS